jgi:thiol-disulfide isomerase/thioredoxin
MTKWVTIKALRALLAIGMLTGLIALTGCYSVSGQPGSGQQSQSLNLDKPAPEFTLNDLQGKPVSLSSFRGKVVMLNFWATYCPPCVEEMPHLQAFYKDWVDKDVVLLAINAGGEDFSTVNSFMQKNGYTFTVLLDSRGEVAGKYNVNLIPVSVFIDREGKIKNRVTGAFRNKAALKNSLPAYCLRIMHAGQEY